MASLRTLAKRLDGRRTWKVTWRDNAKAEFVHAPYNMVAANAKAKRVRLPGKAERIAMRALKTAMESK